MYLLVVWRPLLSAPETGEVEENICTGGSGFLAVDIGAGPKETGSKESEPKESEPEEFGIERIRNRKNSESKESSRYLSGHAVKCPQPGDPVSQPAGLYRLTDLPTVFQIPRGHRRIRGASRISKQGIATIKVELAAMITGNKG